MRSRCIACSSLLLLVVGLTAGVAVAQSDKGAIAGNVLDSSGAVVAGAEITATGAQTGTQYKTKSSSDGAYRLPYVRAGTYNVKITATGFKTTERTDVAVQVNTVSALDITLQAGDVKETVTVVADAPALQTESSDVGTVVSTKQIQDLPLSLSASSQSFLRSPESFVFLTPGTAGPGTNSDHSSGGIFESKLAGGQNFATEVILDGVSTQRADSGSAFDQTAPSVEALREFKVLTSTVPSEFGRTSGGVESFAVKSGTNNFHGTVFNFFRNDKLNANSWNNNFNGAPKGRDHQNDFGGSLGGPVRIPKLYNGHDKLFFFFSWEQYRNNLGKSNVSTLPTAAERSGDFSLLLGPGLVNSDGTPVINPCDGTQVLRGQVFDPATTQTVGGQPCRTAFPGNIIPTGRISTVAQNMLQFLPVGSDTNGPGCNAPICNNFLFTSANPVRDTTMTFKIDFNVSEKGRAFFSYSSRDQENLNGSQTLPRPLDPNFQNSNFTHYLRFGYDYTFSPTVLNHFVVGLNRLANFSRGQSVTGVDWDQVLGITGASGEVFPPITFDNFQSSPIGVNYLDFSAANNDRNIPNSLVVSDSVSWAKGRHTIRVGFEWRSFQFSRISFANTSPRYDFSSFQTAYIPNSNISGDPFASFLLGAPHKESLTFISVQPRWSSNYYAAYVQDDLKLRSNLVLNLGFRYSIDTPRHEPQNANSVLDLTAPNALAGGAPGALIFGSRAAGAKIYYKNFAPRIGFSYAWKNNMVFRGGYSIYYAPLQYSDFGASLTTGTSVSPTFESADNFSAVQSPDQGFPAFPAPVQDPTLLTGTDAQPAFVAGIYGKPGMIQNWSLEFQHELAKDLIFTMGYVGMRSTRLHSNLIQINSINPRFYSLGNDLNLPVGDPQAVADLATLGISVPSWFVPLWSPSGEDTVGQLLRPFPQYRQIDSSPLENAGQSTYHALQAKVERRFRNGLNLLAAYTFSKTLTNADSAFPVFTGFNSNVFGAQNAFNLKAEKSVSYQDIPHALVLSYLYELPVGPGKKFLNHGAASKIAGGWQVGGVHRYQSGSPVMINAFASSNPFANGNFRFSQVPGVPLISPNASNFNPFGADSGCTPHSDGTFTANSSNNFFNCAAIIDPNASDLVTQRGFAFGNMPVFFSGLRSPGYVNEDFSIIKRTTIAEGHIITFKADFPNAFNRHVFGQLDGNPFSGTFGVPGGGGHSVLNAPRQIQLTLRYEF
jgi:carboxypeptidase family protein/TonB-dependent receptor-like protein